MPKSRQKFQKRIQRKLRIFCEGEKTEPNYLDGYIKKARKDILASTIQIEVTKKNTPFELVGEAVNLKKSKSYVDGDEIWVVFDRESRKGYNQELHAKTWKKAKDNDINIAISAVCFEYWILLHLTNSTKCYSSYDDLIRKSTLRTEYVARFGVEYDKANDQVFSHLDQLVETAIARAKANNLEIAEASAVGAKPYELDPYTDIPTLLERIKTFPSPN